LPRFGKKYKFRVRIKPENAVFAGFLIEIVYYCKEFGGGGYVR